MECATANRSAGQPRPNSDKRNDATQQLFKYLATRGAAQQRRLSQQRRTACCHSATQGPRTTLAPEVCFACQFDVVMLLAICEGCGSMQLRDVDGKQAMFSLFRVLRAGNFPTLTCNCQPLRGAAVTQAATLTARQSTVQAPCNQRGSPTAQRRHSITPHLPPRSDSIKDQDRAGTQSLLWLSV